MKIVPLNDKIVVERLEADDKTAGGIILPDTAKEKPKQGKILSVGEGKHLDNGSRADFQVKVGDRVLFTSYAGVGSDRRRQGLPGHDRRRHPRRRRLICPSLSREPAGRPTSWPPPRARVLTTFCIQSI